MDQRSQTISSEDRRQEPSRGHQQKLLVLALVPFIMVLGNSMLVPVLPKMMTVMHLSLFQVGLIITVFSIPAGIVIPLAGALSDHVGRRVVIVPALIVYGAGGLAAGVSSWVFPHPFGWIMASRLLQGIGAGGTYQLAMTVVGDMFEGKSRAGALGKLEAANGLGKVVSPIAGSLLALIIWFAPFFAYGLLSFPIAAIVWWTIKEPAGKKSDQAFGTYWQGLKRTLTQKAGSIAITFLAGALVLFILFGVLSYLADILEKTFKYHELMRGLLIAIPVLASAISSYVSGTVLQKRLAQWSKPVLSGGLALIALAMIAVPFFAVTSVAIALGILVFQGIGTGSVLPAINTMVTSATSSKERGVVTSLYGSVRFFGVALGPPLFSMAMTHRYVVFWSAAGLAIVASLLAWFFLNQQQMLPGPQGGGQVRPAKLGAHSGSSPGSRQHLS